MPPSGFRRRSVTALLGFVQANYEDLLEEVQSGKHPDIETAIKSEITTLGLALEKLHVEKDGTLVER